jgi:hypothetical protein
MLQPMHLSIFPTLSPKASQFSALWILFVDFWYESLDESLGVKKHRKKNSYSRRVQNSKFKKWLKDRTYLMVTVMEELLQYPGTVLYRCADKSLARPGRKQVTATEDFDVHISYLYHNWRNINTIYIYNKTSIKRNILTIKQNTQGSRSG